MIRSYPSKDHLFIHLLGTFLIELNGQPIQLPTKKCKALFAYLILHAEAHSREKLATLFWGDFSHIKAHGSLRHSLAILRRFLSKNIILADRECVKINPIFPMWVDINEFQVQAHQFLINPSIPLNDINTELFMGDLLPDFYDEWVLPLREKNHELNINVMFRAIEQLRAKSEYELATNYAQRLLAYDAANERAYQHLMFCYIATGDRIQALHQFENCKLALKEEYDVVPSKETQALYYWIKEYDSQNSSQAAKISNLPIPISSFVGRIRELTQIKQLLSMSRLVTLSGAGGSGKTRLSIHTATDLIDQYKDGVWWVEFAKYSDPSLVPVAITKALGINVGRERSETEAIVHYIKNRHLLLVLDNCEHLVSAIAQITDTLLSKSQGLKILATSREALGIPGENILCVPTLSVPDITIITMSDLLMNYEGIRLFVERAKAVRNDFLLMEENALSVARICHRLDGIPLAIELAAARINVMAPQKIETCLDDRFNLLITSNQTAHSRHQTLRAAIDWSYDLLSDQERLLFSRLSVFSGGWTIDAAENICSGKGLEQEMVFQLNSRLLEKSLLTMDSDGKRYNMLETIKQYAQEKLMEMCTPDWIKHQHLDYFLALARTADEKVRGEDQLIWIEKMKPEHDNLYGALDYSLNNEADIIKGVQLACALPWYLIMVGEFKLTQFWLEKALIKSEILGNTPHRANILFTAGTYSCWGLSWLNPNEALKLLERCSEIWKEFGDEFILDKAKCMLSLGHILEYEFNNTEGLTLILNSIEIFKLKDQIWWHAWAVNVLSAILKRIPHQDIRSILEEEIILWNKTGDRTMIALYFFDLGTLLMNESDYINSKENLQKSLKIFSEFGSKGFMFQVLENLGNVSRGLSDYDQAEEIYKECITYAQDIGWDSSLADIYYGLGFVALHDGDVEKAEEYLIRSLKISSEYKFKPKLLRCLAGFAAKACVCKENILAIQLFSAYFSQVDGIENKQTFIHPYDLKEIEYYFSKCKEQIEKGEFDQAWETGRLLTLDDVFKDLLGLSESTRLR